VYKVIDEFSRVWIVTVKATASTRPSGSERRWRGVTKGIVLHRDTGEPTFVAHSFPLSDMAKFLPDSRCELLLAEYLDSDNLVKVLVYDTGCLVND
jgi:hypothetical protein